jgi:hypothetical protein
MNVIPGRNLGRPAEAKEGRENVRLLGAVAINDTVFAFVIARMRDGSTQLWCKQAPGNVWQEAWVPLGQPGPGIAFDRTFQGGVLASGLQLFAFVCGSDGHLHCAYWNGLAWAWVRIGQPTGHAVQAVGLAQPNPFGVYATAGNATWVAVWNGLSWGWMPVPGVPLASTTDEMLRLRNSPVWKLKFQIADDGTLVAGAGGDNLISCARYVYFSGDLGDHIGVRGRNPDGTGGEIIIGQYARPEQDPLERHRIEQFGVRMFIDLRRTDNPMRLQPGADCWGYTSQGGNGHESAANFTYDPASPVQRIYYKVSRPRVGHPSFSLPAIMF